MMPGGISGKQLADIVRQRYPGLPVLFTTGFDGDLVRGAGALGPDALVLRKYGIDLAPVDDTMVLSYVLGAGSHGHGLDELAELHFQQEMAEEAKQATEKLQGLTDEQDKLAAKQERGKLTGEEKERMKALEEEISAALYEAEIAVDAAEIAKGIEGSELRGAQAVETKRKVRAQAGDVAAASEEVAKATQQAVERAEKVSKVGPQAKAPAWVQRIADIGEMMRPGSGVQSLAERGMTGIGATGWLSKQGARAGRFLGMDEFEGMSDAEIEQMAAARQRGAEEVYEGRSIFKDLFGIGTVSSRASREEASQREVAEVMTENAQEEMEEAKRLRETMGTGMEDLKGAVERSGMMNLLGGMFRPKEAGDLILPAKGGSPIITDERDTLMATRPGGPLERAMGGKGGGGTVQVNVYGGDQKQVYDTVMKALKATGNA